MSVTMRRFDLAFYRECKEVGPDRLVLEGDTSIVPVKILVGMYKWCRNHSIYGEVFRLIRDSLVNQFGLDFKQLEVTLDEFGD